MKISRQRDFKVREGVAAEGKKEGGKKIGNWRVASWLLPLFKRDQSLEMLPWKAYGKKMST